MLKQAQYDDLQQRLKTCLVGKLHNERHFNKEALKNTLKMIWKLYSEEDTLIRDLEENLFIFQFSNDDDKLNIISGRSWSFEKSLVLIDDVNGLVSPIGETQLLAMQLSGYRFMICH